MALDKDRLGNALADRIITIMGASAPIAADETALRTLMKALADEIVKEIVTNAQATGTTAVVGGSSAGSHTTTIPIGGVT